MLYKITRIVEDWKAQEVIRKITYKLFENDAKAIKFCKDNTPTYDSDVSYLAEKVIQKEILEKIYG